ncbi:S-adenosyl-L-methionine-dependent methyltransferase [Polychaeton citri CBS 116435]|uniref:S-adenosyl-L-methionine-dependent methyltransferase n=1 Tax=Polychaeton citri CBS 116435 TaxID=1314669 RepID=A0A9P4QGT0_9PEZI|nr:S-adenosyl-L-methionine-dependent methyltransferase [Polychaeton citri CBS 116435]
MTTEEHDMWDGLNVEYEHAYGNNPFKKALVSKAITLLQPGSCVLDVGCGTGVPVSQKLTEAGMEVVGTDVAPKMVKQARRRVKGTFEVADMVGYVPTSTYDGVFIIYSHLGLIYSAFHNTVYTLARSLRPRGLLMVGQSPVDNTYVEGYNLPFWGEPFATLMFTRQGQRRFLESINLEILYDTLDLFKPHNPRCDSEHQQYLIARRKGDEEVQEPTPLPT